MGMIAVIQGTPEPAGISKSAAMVMDVPSDKGNVRDNISQSIWGTKSLTQPIPKIMSHPSKGETRKRRWKVVVCLVKGTAGHCSVSLAVMPGANPDT